MKNWRPSEVIAVVLLVMIIGFLAYVGITAEKDLVGEESRVQFGTVENL